MVQKLMKLMVKDAENTGDLVVRRRYGVAVGVIGILLNILLFAGKLLAGIITASISIIADAFNNLSDAGSSVITLIGFKMAGKPADHEHPFGHGRMEYVSGLIVSLVIMFMGFELAKSSLEKIISPSAIEFSLLSLVILIGAIVVKLGLFCLNRSVGRLISSSAMKATAMDSLSDVAATSAVIIGVIVNAIWSLNIDGYIGMLVSAFILYTGFQTARESLSPLLGQRPEKAFVEDIQKTVMSYNGIVGVHDLIIHNYGVGVVIITLHAEVPSEMDFVKAHELIDIIEGDLKVKYNTLATIHMDPVDSSDEETVALRKRVGDLAKELDDSLTIHDFRMTKGTNHINLIFDLVLPYHFRLSDEEVVAIMSEKIKGENPHFFTVINIDKDMC